jgi:hypothetical protein
LEKLSCSKAKQSEQQLAFMEHFASNMEKIIHKKSVFEVYEDNKKRLQFMLERGDIDQEEASVLLGKIKRELLSDWHDIICSYVIYVKGVFTCCYPNFWLVKQYMLNQNGSFH